MTTERLGAGLFSLIFMVLTFVMIYGLFAHPLPWDLVPVIGCLILMTSFFSYVTGRKAIKGGLL